MAVNASTIWEIRSDGSTTNGGGFADLNPGTSVDYSQQTSAQLSVSDIATDGAGTGVSSATGGFTAAMEGNVIYIGGGSGLTPSWYQITAYTDTNNITIDRSAGASGTGGTGNVGGAWDYGSAENTFFNIIAGGNTVWFKKGTYTTSQNIDVSARNMWSDTQIYIRGYNATRGDECKGTNRPTIIGSTYSWLLGDFWSISNLIYKTGHGGYMQTRAGTQLANIKFDDVGSSKGNMHLTLGGNGNGVFGCEFVGTNQSSSTSIVSCGSNRGSFSFCYFHGAGKTNGYGVYVAQRVSFVNCIFNSLSYGVYAGSSAGSPILTNCVVYNCATGIYVYYYFSRQGVLNTIFQNCTVGMYGQAADDANVTQYCTFYNNTTNKTNGSLHFTDLTSDPKMVDPSNEDFSLDSDSPCFDAGIGLSFAGIS